MKLDYANTEDIKKDALKAQKHGISYGRYKAGERNRSEKSEYTESATEIVKKTELKQDDSKKAVAFIK